MNEKLVNIEFSHAGVTHKLSDHLRKTYAVEERVNGGEWVQVGTYNNSTEANERAGQVIPDCGQEARVVVVQVDVVPKKSFWELWRTKSGKAALKSAGVYVTKNANGAYVVTLEKVTKRQVLRAKGYGWNEYSQGLRDGSVEADYVLKSKCLGEFDCLEAEGYGHLVTEGDRRIEAGHQERGM